MGPYEKDSIVEDDHEINPADGFALLADTNRFELIEILAAADQDRLPFNDLYERSAFDDSGQFNYHLDQLVGPFIRKTEDGYQLRHAARIAYRLAIGGLLSDRGEAQITTIESPCPECGHSQMRALYEGDRFWVRCEDCKRRSVVGPFPPRALAKHAPQRAPIAFDRYTMGNVLRAAENVCPWCASPLNPSLQPADEGWPAVDWVIRRGCTHCEGWIYTRVYDLLRLHPAVISFYYRHGVDVLGASFWAAETLMADEMTVHTDVEDWAAQVKLAYDDDTIELGVPADIRVSSIEPLSTTE